MSIAAAKDITNCKKCKHVIVNTFKFCQYCGTENVGLKVAARSRTSTSFGDLEYNCLLYTSDAADE